jgi:hypothetical protein
MLLQINNLTINSVKIRLPSFSVSLIMMLATSLTILIVVSGMTVSLAYSS